MSGAQIAKLVSSFSLAIFACAASTQTYGELADRLRTAKSPDEVHRIIDEFPTLLDRDSQLSETLEAVDNALEIEEVRDLVALRISAGVDTDSQATQQAKAIKSNPLYQDPGIQEQSNWLDGAIRRLLGLIPRRSNRTSFDMPATAIPGWIVPGMWVLLGVAVLVFGYFVLRHFTWKKALKRRAKAMLEDDEPERTLDEWLALADQHLEAGNYREAVRAMYLSCLLKFDEAGIARFIRGETNWEHYERIQASIKRPQALDFRPPTQAFDRIWYGYHVNGREDVEQFRHWYNTITEAIRGVKK